MAQRLLQFDMLKGIGILCVLLGHTVIYGYPIELIYGFHMPLFFFCSGVFYKQRRISETLIKSFKQLLIPYVFFCIVLNTSYLVLDLKADYGFFNSINCVIDKLSPFDENGHLYLSIWFLPCLFIVRMMYCIIDNINVCKIIKYGIIVSFYVMALFIEIPFFIDTAMASLIYYAIGRRFKETNLFEKAVSWKYALLIFAVYCMIIVVFHPKVELKSNIYPWYLVFISMGAIYAIYQFCLRFSENSNCITHFISRCGNASLVLLGLHRPLWLFVYPVCLALHLPIIFFIIVQMISALLIILWCDKLLNRYAPFLIGKF